MKYLVIIEQTRNNFAAYSPDVPGCVATGRTEAEVIKAYRQALEMHLEGLREDGLPLPRPLARVQYIEAAGFAD